MAECPSPRGQGALAPILAHLWGLRISRAAAAAPGSTEAATSEPSSPPGWADPGRVSGRLRSGGRGRCAGGRAAGGWHESHSDWQCGKERASACVWWGGGQLQALHLFPWLPRHSSRAALHEVPERFLPPQQTCNPSPPSPTPTHPTCGGGAAGLARGTGAGPPGRGPGPPPTSVTTWRGSLRAR